MLSRHGKIALSAIIVAALVLALGLFSHRSIADKGTFEPHTLTIVFTSDDWGRAKPCGCGPKGHLGGLPRRATYLNQLRESYDHLLLLDMGDAGSGMGDLAQIKADLYGEAFVHMGYDAVGLGDWEVRFMTDLEVPNLYGGKLPVICANVLNASTVDLLADEPYIIKTMDSGLRVGIISVIGEHLLPPGNRSRMGIGVIPAADAIREHIESIRKQSDIVILLSHTQADIAKHLASEIPGIDVILSGHTSPNLEEPVEQIGDTIHMHAMPYGQEMARLVLEIDADRRITSFTGEYDELTRHIEDDAHMAKLIDEHDEAIAEHHRQLHARHRIPEDDTKQVRTPTPFVSADTCRGCHASQYESWSKTGHAKAYESLKIDNRTRDAECLSCHTTGFTAVGGFTEESATPQFKGVQCESCHGPGVRHARQAAAQSDAGVGGYGTVMEMTCTRCHDPANSPAFEYRKFKSRIMH